MNREWSEIDGQAKNSTGIIFDLASASALAAIIIAIVGTLINFGLLLWAIKTGQI